MVGHRRWRLVEPDWRAAGGDGEAPRGGAEGRTAADDRRGPGEIDPFAGPLDLRSHGHRRERQRTEKVEREVRDSNVAAPAQAFDRATEERGRRAAVLQRRIPRTDGCGRGDERVVALLKVERGRFRLGHAPQIIQRPVSE